LAGYEDGGASGTAVDGVRHGVLPGGNKAKESKRTPIVSKTNRVSQTAARKRLSRGTKEKPRQVVRPGFVDTGKGR
jgi:hypothetical protein